MLTPLELAVSLWLHLNSICIKGRLSIFTCLSTQKRRESSRRTLFLPVITKHPSSTNWQVMVPWWTSILLQLTIKKLTLRRIHLKPFISKTRIPQVRTRGPSELETLHQFSYLSTGASINRKTSRKSLLKMKISITESSQQTERFQEGNISILISTFAHSTLNHILNMQTSSSKIFQLLQCATHQKVSDPSL